MSASNNEYIFRSRERHAPANGKNYNKLNTNGQAKNGYIVLKHASNEKHRAQRHYEWTVRLDGARSECASCSKKENKLPSSDMGVLFNPLLRVQRLRRAQRHSLKLFVVFKYAPNRLFVSRVS